jgi:hypothetical protein
MVRMGGGLASLLLLLVGCVAPNGDSTGEQGGPCTTGLTIECPCLGGRVGIQTCGADGAFGVCECGGGVDGGSPPEPCEVDAEESRACPGGAEQLRACVDGAWGPWSSCPGDPQCGDAPAAPCGLNGRGAGLYECEDGVRRDLIGCTDPDECVDGGRQRTPCGLNDNGRSERACEAGRWTPGECVDPDECSADERERRGCGINGAGEQVRACEGGRLTAWSPCDDPDAECATGAREDVPCGLNRRGRQSHTCGDAGWGPWTDCEDPDACVDAALERRACGAGGEESRECVSGAWRGWSACDEVGECAEGEEERQACGQGGAQGRTCVGGVWSAWSPCEGGDAVCDEGEEEIAACEGPGERRRVCAQGAWGAWSPCPDVAGCPQPIVGEPELEVQPLETVSLDGSGSRAGGGRLVRYEWVVVDRPEGSTAEPLESFASPNRPQNGGAPDNLTTPRAVFFVDLAGTYEFELRVTDNGGRSAPSEDCPGPRARMRVISRSGGGVHLQLVWSTPGDGNEADDQGADLDIHLRHPTGRTWSTSPHDCYFANNSPDWGPAGSSGDPSLDIDDVASAGPENINLETPEETGPLGGPYKVGVHAWNLFGSFGNADLGPSDVTLRIFLDGELEFEAERRFVADKDLWEAADIFWENGVGRAVQNGAVIPNHAGGFGG